MIEKNFTAWPPKKTLQLDPISTKMSTSFLHRHVIYEKTEKLACDPIWFYYFEKINEQNNKGIYRCKYEKLEAKYVVDFKSKGKF